MPSPEQNPITVGPAEGTSISVVGDTYRILVSGKQTGGAFATIDMLVPAGGGPGPHAHADFQETFYVVEGEIEVRSTAGVYTAGKGSYIVIPKGGVVHNFKNKKKETAHLLCVVVPAGLEEFFLAIGEPVTPGNFLPPPEMNPEKIKELTETAERYGQKLFPPDYLG